MELGHYSSVHSCIVMSYNFDNNDNAIHAPSANNTTMTCTSGVNSGISQANSKLNSVINLDSE